MVRVNGNLCFDVFGFGFAGFLVLVTSSFGLVRWVCGFPGLRLLFVLCFAFCGLLLNCGGFG